MPDPDAELMMRLRGGDETAFTTLVRSWQGRVVSLAARYLRSAADAEDTAQEVFLRVWRARGSYEPTARFSTWIYRITVNVSLNHLRGRKARRALSAELPEGGAGAREVEDPDAQQPHDAVEDSELGRVLEEVLATLPERQRMAILLNKYQGLSYEQVAEAMDLSVMAVRSLLTRARVSIKDRVLPYLLEGEAPARPEADDEL